MQFAIPLQQFDEKKVFFCNRTDNTVLSGGSFYRIMYCDHDTTMLGVHILFDVDVSLETDSFEMKTVIDKTSEAALNVVTDLINTIYSIWRTTQQHPKPLSLGPTHNLVYQSVARALETKRPTTHKSNKYTFVFKCSGLFDTDQETGITYRLLNATSC